MLDLGTCNTTRGVFMGGEISGGLSNFMDYITIASTGNGTDFGDLNVSSLLWWCRNNFFWNIRICL